MRFAIATLQYKHLIKCDDALPSDDKGFYILRGCELGILSYYTDKGYMCVGALFELRCSPPTHHNHHPPPPHSPNKKGSRYSVTNSRCSGVHACVSEAGEARHAR